MYGRHIIRSLYRIRIFYNFVLFVQLFSKGVRLGELFLVTEKIVLLRWRPRVLSGSSFAKGRRIEKIELAFK